MIKTIENPEDYVGKKIIIYNQLTGEKTKLRLGGVNMFDNSVIYTGPKYTQDSVMLLSDYEILIINNFKKNGILKLV